MDPNYSLRMLLIVAFALFVPIAVFYRIQSQKTGEKLDRRQEGFPMLLTLRPVGLAGIASFIAYLINPAWMAWSSVSLPIWLRYSGLVPALIGMCLTLWAFRSLGKNLTDTVVTRKEHTLVTSGPYVWIRHPFYTAVALLILGSSLVAANWFLFSVGVIVFFLFTIRTRREEANLIARFGDRYSAYMRRTGRYFPKTILSR